MVEAEKNRYCDDEDLESIVCGKEPSWAILSLGLLGFGVVLYGLYCKLKVWWARRKLRPQCFDKRVREGK